MYLTEVFKEDTKFMKIKKSHIFLISLLSILLLLSLAAVSAASDSDDISASAADDLSVSTANDVQDLSISDIGEVEDLSETINEEVSEGEGGEGGEEPAVPKNTTIQSDNLTLKYGDNVTINITIKDNDSNNVSFTKDDIQVSNGTYNYSFILSDDNKTLTLTNSKTDNKSRTFNLGEYTLFLKFLGNENYTASETNITLNVTKTGTTVNASDVRVNYGKDIVIPVTITIDANKTLNITNMNKTHLNVTCNDTEIDFTQEIGGLKLNWTYLSEQIAQTFNIKIKYSGNDNCNGSEGECNLTILDNTTVSIIDYININPENNNVTISINIKNGEENLLDVSKENITLVLNYKHNETNRTVVTIDYDNFTLDNLGDGNYNISFIKGVQDALFNDVLLTIIYANDTFNATNTTLRFIESYALIIVDNITVDDVNKNITVPISVNFTSKIIAVINGTQKTNTTVTPINLTAEDLLLWVSYFDGAEYQNKTVDFERVDCENKIYNITFSTDGIEFHDATFTIIYDNGTLNATNETVSFSNVYDVIIIDNITVDNETKNYTVPISVNYTSSIVAKINGTTVTNASVNTETLESGNITLQLVYNDGTENKTVWIDNETFAFVGEDGKYNITFALDYPLNDAKLYIIYKNGTIDADNETVSFTKTYAFVNVPDTAKFNNHTGNVTIPVAVNMTSKITAPVNGKNVTQQTVEILNFTADDIKLNLTYKDGENNVTVEISGFEFVGENGTYNVSFVDEAAKLDNSTLSLIFGSGLNETKKNITLNGYLNLIAIAQKTTNDYQDGYFEFIIKDKDTDALMKNTNITVGGLWFYTFDESSSMGGSKVYTTDGNGLLSIKNENLNPNLDITGYTNKYVSLPVGSYNITLKGSDSLVLDANATITVTPVAVSFIADNKVSEYKQVVNYSYQLVNAKTNQPIRFVAVTFRIYSDSGSIDAIRGGITDMNGMYTSPSINLTAGNYTLELSTNDTENLIAASTKRTLTVNKILGTITAKSRTIQYGSAPIAIATVKDENGKVMANTYVLMQVFLTAKKSVNYAVQTDSNGVAKLNYVSLSVGKHKIIMTILDNNYRSTQLVRYVTVKKATKAKFTAAKVKTYYRSGKIFKIKLTNTKYKVGIYGGKVLIKVFISKTRYYRFKGTTSANGLIQFRVSFKPGTYKVVISSNDNGYVAKNITRQIKVTRAPIKMKAVSTKVKKGNKFQVKVTSKKNKKVLSNVKLKISVYTGKKYKTYTKKTNKKGIANLKITQKVGKHKVIVKVANKKLYRAGTLKKTLKVTKK